MISPFPPFPPIPPFPPLVRHALALWVLVATLGATACVPVRAPLLDVDSSGSGVDSGTPADDVAADVPIADGWAADVGAADVPATQLPDSSVTATDASDTTGYDLEISDAASLPEDSTIADATAEDSDENSDGTGLTDIEDGLGTPDADASADADAGGAQACFIGDAPGSDTPVADVPQPDLSGCTLPPPKFFGATQPVPAPSLKVEIGTNNPNTGDFSAYTPDQWVPLVHGPQGGFHVFAAIRVSLPGVSDASVKMQAEVRGYGGCSLVANDQQPVLYLHPDVAANTYTNTTKFSPGSLVIFAGSSVDSKLYCGTWLRLVARARRFGTDQWGEASVIVRLYDQL